MAAAAKATTRHFLLLLLGLGWMGAKNAMVLVNITMGTGHSNSRMYAYEYMSINTDADDDTRTKARSARRSRHGHNIQRGEGDKSHPENMAISAQTAAERAASTRELTVQQTAAGNSSASMSAGMVAVEKIELVNAPGPTSSLPRTIALCEWPQ